VAHFKVPFQYLPGETEERDKSSRVTDIVFEI
jgi:hypothetical protein